MNKNVKYALGIFAIVIAIILITPQLIMANQPAEQQMEPTETISPPPEAQDGNEQPRLKSHAVVFTIPEDRRDSMHFENGAYDISYNIDEGGVLAALPVIYGSDGNELGISVWNDGQGGSYSMENLLAMPIGGEITLEPVITFTAAQQPPSPEPEEKEDISEILPEQAAEGLLVIPNPQSKAGSSEYAATDEGMKHALFDIYQYGGGESYTIYLADSIVIDQSGLYLGRKGSEANTYEDITLSALAGKAAKLTFAGSATDPADSGTKAPADAAELIFSDSEATHFGTDIEFRNIKYGFNTFYMNGHDLTLGNGSYFISDKDKYIYGGSDAGEAVAADQSLDIIVNSTGDGALYLRGGSYTGTFTGGINITVNDTSATGKLNIYGGGEGTEAAPANLNGDISVTVNALGGSLDEYFGGVRYGDISGNIRNTIKGKGSLANADTFFYGGSYSGNIGAGEEGAVAIYNDVDTSEYTGDNWLRYAGANAHSGDINGNVENKVRAGAYGAGGINGYTAANANDGAVNGDVMTEARAGVFSKGEGEEGFAYTGKNIRGKAIAHWGTEGLVYGGDTEKMESATGKESAWNIYGATETYLYNVLADAIYSTGYTEIKAGILNELHSGASTRVNGGSIALIAPNNIDGDINVEIDSAGAQIGKLGGIKQVEGARRPASLSYNIKNVKSLGAIDAAEATINIGIDTGNLPEEGAGEETAGAQVQDDDRIIHIADGIAAFANLNIYGIILHTDGALSGGDVLLDNGGLSLGKDSEANIAKLTAKGVSRLSAPAGEDKFILSEYEAQDNALLHADIISGVMQKAMGTWFGDNKAYVLFTFKDGGASGITPASISASINDESLIADNDGKHGLLMHGAFYDVKVSEGSGFVKHDVDGVSNSSEGGNINAFGDIASDTNSSGFRLAIPEGKDILPHISIVPDDSGSWVKRITVNGEVVAADKLNAEGEIWESPAKTGSYSIDAAFSNQPELVAQSAIITQSEARAIEDINGIKALTKAKGMPLFGHNINAALLQQIREDLLEGEAFREHEIEYTSGAANGDQYALTVKIVVVPDADTEITDDKQFALHAKDVTMGINELNEIQDEQQLVERTQAMLITANGDVDTDSVEVEPSAIEGLGDASNDKNNPIQFKAMTASGLLTRGIGIQGVNDVARIVNGGGQVLGHYRQLDDAIQAANDNDTDEKLAIELLVDSNTVDKLTIDRAVPKLNNGHITSYNELIIRQAPPGAYQGGNKKATISFGGDPYGSETLIDKGKYTNLIFEDVVLDGTHVQYETTELIDVRDRALILRNNVQVQNFHTKGPLITSSGNLLIMDSSIVNNQTQSALGLIHNTNNLQIMSATDAGVSMIALNGAPNGSIIYNDSDNLLTIANCVIVSNHVSDDGYGFYLKKGRLGIGKNVTVYDNTHIDNKNETRQHNVYLSNATSTPGDAYTYMYISGSGDMSNYENNTVGFMANTSGANGGKGEEGMLVATYGTAATEAVPDELINVFKHDQYSYNTDALIVMKDKVGQKNLVLGKDVPPRVHFSFTKVNASDLKDALQGAEFNIYECNNPDSLHSHAEVVTEDLISAGTCWQPVMDGNSYKAFASGANGLVDIGELDNGVYMLVETKAPDGFMRPLGQWRVEVDSYATAGQRLIISGVGEQAPPAFARDAITGDLLLPNMLIIKAPHTGGWGPGGFMLIGLAIMALGAVVFMVSKTKLLDGLKRIIPVVLAVMLAASGMFNATAALAAPPQGTLEASILSGYSEGFGEINLTWTPVLNGQQYELYRSAPNVDGNYTAVHADGSGGEFTDTNLEHNSTYYYYVKVINGTDYSISNYVQIKTDRKALTLMVNYAVGTSAKLEWTEVDGASAYMLLRSNGADYYTIVTTSNTMHVNHGLAYDQLYTYYVVACDSNYNEIERSNIVSVKTPPAPAPTAAPTPAPTAPPAPLPTAPPAPKPTAAPTPRPTAAPTPKPTPKPTAKPTPTPAPVGPAAPDFWLTAGSNEETTVKWSWRNLSYPHPQYNIYISESANGPYKLVVNYRPNVSNAKTGELYYSINQTPYNPQHLVDGKVYYIKMSASDPYGNEGPMSSAARYFTAMNATKKDGFGSPPSYH